MSFTDSDFLEFKQEVDELLNAGEQALLELSSGGNFNALYDTIFRTFHNIKGAAGLIELHALESHMHELENILSSQKNNQSLSAPHIDLLLRGIDTSRALMSGKDCKLDYSLKSVDALTSQSSTTPVPANQKATQPDRLIFKIVAVDDSKTSLDRIVEALNTTGYFEVHPTTDPHEALKLAENLNVDLVLTDYEMPQMNGMAVLQSIRKRDPNLPVIFLSGKVQKAMLLEALKNGVHAVVEKPFEDGDIIQTCLSAARRYHLDKLFQKSVHLILFQFSDLDDLLKRQGREDIRKLIREELKNLIESKRHLRAA